MGSGAGSLLHRREGVGKGGICANEIDVYWRTIKPFPEVSCRKGKERAKITDRKNLDFLLKAVSAGKERNRLLKHLSSSVQNSDIQHAGLRCNKFVYAPSSSFRNLSPDRVVFLVCVYRDRLHEGANAVLWLHSQPINNKDNKDLRLSRDISIRLPTPQNKDLKEKEKKQKNDAKIGNSVLTTELKT